MGIKVINRENVAIRKSIAVNLKDLELSLVKRIQIKPVTKKTKSLDSVYINKSEDKTALKPRNKTHVKQPYLGKTIATVINKNSHRGLNISRINRPKTINKLYRTPKLKHQREVFVYERGVVKRKNTGGMGVSLGRGFSTVKQVKTINTGVYKKKSVVLGKPKNDINQTIDYEKPKIDRQKRIVKYKPVIISSATEKFPTKTVNMTKTMKPEPRRRRIVEEPRIKRSRYAQKQQEEPLIVPQRSSIKQPQKILSNKSAEILENHKKFVASPKLINKIQQDVTTEYTLTVLPEFLNIIEDTLERINQIKEYPHKEEVIKLVNELKNNNILCELLVLISMSANNNDILYYVSEKIYELKDYTSLMTRIIKLQMLYKDVLKSKESEPAGKLKVTFA